MEITVLNRQRTRRIARSSLERFIARLVREQRPGDAGSIALSLVSDDRMRQFNRTFREIDRPTDVLAFPSGDDEEPAPDEPRHLGDIVICVPYAARQAREAGHSLIRELQILTLHGYLHLLGYDHEHDDGTMRRLELRLRRRLFPIARRIAS